MKISPEVQSDSTPNLMQTYRKKPPPSDSLPVPSIHFHFTGNVEHPLSRWQSPYETETHCLEIHSCSGNSCWPELASVTFPLAQCSPGHLQLGAKQMELFFHGWLISIGCYVEKLISHDCCKRKGGVSEVQAKFPGRPSLKRLLSKCPEILY